MRKLLAACSGCLMVAAASVVMLTAGTARAQDADAGKKVFNQCRACHVLDKTTNRVGPHLGGLIGRKAGSVEGFSYSDAMKNSGITWDEEAARQLPEGPERRYRRQQDGLRRREEGRRSEEPDRLSEGRNRQVIFLRPGERPGRPTLGLLAVRGRSVRFPTN